MLPSMAFLASASTALFPAMFVWHGTQWMLRYGRLCFARTLLTKAMKVSVSEWPECASVAVIARIAAWLLTPMYTEGMLRSLRRRASPNNIPTCLPL